MALNFPHFWKRGDVITAQKLNEIETAITNLEENINSKISQSVENWLENNSPKIENKSIGKEKLSDSVQSELDKINNIGTLSNLQTENKQDIVNAINEIKNSITGDVLTPEIKEALLYIAKYVVYEKTENGQQCFDKLSNALQNQEVS